MDGVDSLGGPMPWDLVFIGALVVLVALASGATLLAARAERDAARQVRERGKHNRELLDAYALEIAEHQVTKQMYRNQLGMVGQLTDQWRGAEGRTENDVIEGIIDAIDRQVGYLRHDGVKAVHWTTRYGTSTVPSPPYSERWWRQYETENREVKDASDAV